MVGHRAIGDADLVTFFQAGMFAQNNISVFVLMPANIVDDVVG